MKMGKILGICISEKRGTKKKEIPSAEIQEGWGIVGDAHGGNWHRQISLLSHEKIEDFRERGAKVEYGAFGENLIVEGFDLREIPVGTQFRVGNAEIEISQIGKDCHTHCEIYHTMGDCIMPREGVFAKVLKSGAIRVGDEVVIVPQKRKRKMTAAVITASDKGYAGERRDESGPLIESHLRENGYDVIETLLLADNQEDIERHLKRLSDQRQVNLILTTGGTGFAQRDCTPEATICACDRMANGIAEEIRAYSMKLTKRAMFSRGVSGIRGNTLIINLPGSPKAVAEILEYLLPELSHGLEVLQGSVEECART